MDKQIVALKQQGKSLREIAKELGIPHTTVQYKLRKLSATVQTVQDHVVQPEPVNQEDVQSVQSEPVQSSKGQYPTPKLEVVYKRTDPEVQPYLHLFPEDVETFSFHVPGSPPLGVRNLRKVYGRNPNARWEDVYFVLEGYIWPDGVRPEIFIKPTTPNGWTDRDVAIWQLHRQGRDYREIGRALKLKEDYVYKKLRNLSADVESASSG